MTQVTLNGKKYQIYADLVKSKARCLIGSSNGINLFIKDSGLIKGTDYCYARCKDGVWMETATYSKRYGTILFSDEWVKSFETGLRPLPPLLELRENEHFRNDSGEIYEVEVRGTRHHKSCYFKVSDVAICFDIKKLIHTITHAKSGYELGYDYVNFNIQKLCNAENKDIKTKKKPSAISKKESLYFTYHGLIRTIIASKSGNARSFLDWMMEVLFAAHLGTPDQKAKVASKLLGVDYATVLSFCGAINTKISAIYLFRIGSVGDLRDKLNIPKKWPNKASVYKYGRTDDIKRRFKNHLDGKYSEKNGFQTSLITMWFVDKDMYVEAEAVLKNHLNENGWRLNNKEHTEIAIFNMNKSTMIKELDPLFREYASEVRTLEKRIQELENENKLLRCELQAKDNEIELLQQADNKGAASHKKEIQIVKKNAKKEIAAIQKSSDKELKMKDKEIAMKDKEIKMLSDATSAEIRALKLELKQANKKIKQLKGN